MLSNLISMLLYPRIPKIKNRWSSAMEFKDMHFWSEEKIIDYSDNRKVLLLRYAATKCPYYNNIFKERGWDPEKAEQYWNEWPILTQDQLQKHRDEILSTDITKNDMVLDASGGSSGKVKSFFHTKDYCEYSLSTAYHTDSIAGWRPGCKTAYLWAAPCDTKAHKGLVPRLKSYLQNIRLYDSFDMGLEEMNKFHQDLSKYRPEVIIGIAGSVFQMARFLKDKGVRPNYPTKGIVTSAETLTQEMREVIEDVFGPIVFNRYGCREVGLIAFEDDAHCGLHVNFPGNLVEICETGTNKTVCDKEGDVLVTTLTQKYFPLIRYQVGDVAVQTKRKCKCGRNSPLLAKVSGRSSDFVTATNGRKIHGEYFSHILRVGEKIRQYTAVQKTHKNISIQIVLSEPLTIAEKSHILGEFEKTLGHDMQIDFSEVEHIPPLPSGKRRFVLSLLDD